MYTKHINLTWFGASLRPYAKEIIIHYTKARLQENDMEIKHSTLEPKLYPNKLTHKSLVPKEIDMSLTMADQKKRPKSL